MESKEKDTLPPVVYTPTPFGPSPDEIQSQSDKADEAKEKPAKAKKK